MSNSIKREPRFVESQSIYIALRMMCQYQVGNLSEHLEDNMLTCQSEFLRLSPSKQYMSIVKLLLTMGFINSLINTLVMDYLVSEGYPSAAQNFALEANIQPRADVESIQERVEIRNAMYGGDIQTAIEKINELNPQVCKYHSQCHTPGGLASPFPLL